MFIDLTNHSLSFPLAENLLISSFPLELRGMKVGYQPSRNNRRMLKGGGAL